MSNFVLTEHEAARLYHTLDRVEELEGLLREDDFKLMYSLQIHYPHLRGMTHHSTQEKIDGLYRR